MEAMIARLEEAAALCRKYGLDPAGLDGAEVRDFRLQVAVLGAFNTGKSTLVNALLGTAAAPASLTGEARLPAEFFYGPARVTLVRDSGESRSDLSVLAGDPPEGALLVRARLPVPGLAELPDVSVLDTPGAGRVPADLVRDAGAYLLVFGADAPVITERLAAFLSALDLAGRDVLCVLTKCDSFSPRQLDEIAAQLTQSLREQLGLSAELCRAQRGRAPAEATEFLRRVQRRAARARADLAGELLRRGAAPLERYLTGRLETRRLLEPELAGRADALAARLDELHDAADRLHRRALALLDRAAEEAAAHSRETLASLTGPLTDLLGTGQDPVPFADGAVLCLVRAEASARLFPVLEAYEKALRRLAELQGVTLPPCPVQADPVFAGTRGLFARAGRDPRALERALEALVRESLAAGGRQAAQRLQSRLGGPLDAQMASLHKALEDARARQRAEAEEQRRTDEEWRRDLARLNDLMKSAEEECTHAV